MSVFYPLYYRIYRLPLGTVFLLMAFFVLLWAVIAVTFGKKLPKIWKTVNAALLLFLTFSIVYYTLLRRAPNPENRVILMPFASLEAAKQQQEIYRELTMNMLLFFPVGLFLPQLLPRRWKAWQKVLATIAAGLLLSAGIETIQYFYALGDAETDDVITNALGAAIGSLHILLAGGLSRLTKKKNSPAKK